MARKYGEEFSKHHHNRHAKKTLNRHVHKLNKKQINSFEKQCVIISSFLNQGGIYAHCSFIGLEYAGFNSLCISNTKRFILKQHQQKIMVKYVWTENDIRIRVLFHLLKPHMQLTQIPKQVNRYLLHHQSCVRILPQSYGHHLVFYARKCMVLEWNNGK